MIQKVLKVGSSAAVTIPKKSLKELGIRFGDSVTLKVDTKSKTVSIRPVEKGTSRQKKIAELTLNFVNRYRGDIEALARK